MLSDQNQSYNSDHETQNFITCKFEARRKVLLMRVLARLSQECLVVAFDTWSFAIKCRENNSEKGILKDLDRGERSLSGMHDEVNGCLTVHTGPVTGSVVDKGSWALPQVRNFTSSSCPFQSSTLEGKSTVSASCFHRDCANAIYVQQDPTTQFFQAAPYLSRSSPIQWA